jgi:hypothetical protein
LIIYSFWGVFDIIKLIKNDYKAFFIEFFNYVRIAKITFYLMNIFVTVSLYYTIMVDIINDDGNFINTTRACELNGLCEIVDNVMICLTMIYFLKFLDSNIIKPFIQTLLLSWKSIIVFLTSYFFSVTGYAIFCNFVYGPDVFGKISFLI